MHPAAHTQASLTPYGSFEGFQDAANRAFVSGWAWNRATPDIAVTVEVYDNETLLASLPADSYRKDLRDAGIGDGKHGFAYSLTGQVRDRKAHHITVRIAGTDAILRDVRTGGIPSSITRRDLPPTIPHFSMTPARRWWYFTALRHALSLFPQPVWRLLAIVLGCVHMVLDRQSRVLNVALLRALQRPTSLVSCARLHWMRAYQRQVDLILLDQHERITPQWAARHVRYSGTIPPGGAILVSVHHCADRLAGLALAAHGYHLGMITTRLDDSSALMTVDPTLRQIWCLTARSMEHAFGDRQFAPHEAGRKGLQLLRAGGYLMLFADEAAQVAPFSPLLGKSVTVPRGAVWFARHSGKPLIPYMVVPEGSHWRLWVGEAVPLTQQGLCHALGNCIQRAPGSWQRYIAMSWLAAPSADTDMPTG